MRDGITLSADLVLPRQLPAPSVVIRTPYGKAGERQSRRNTALAEAGYVAVIADVRGRGDSEGIFQPYRNDGPDGADVIAWAAAQDWCTGDVATYGGSYGGRMPQFTEDVEVALQRLQGVGGACGAGRAGLAARG